MIPPRVFASDIVGSLILQGPGERATSALRKGAALCKANELELQQLISTPVVQNVDEKREVEVGRVRNQSSISDYI